jgi:hypothetical protein
MIGIGVGFVCFGGGGGGSSAERTPGALDGGALEPIIVVPGRCSRSGAFEFSAGELSATLPESRVLELFALRRPMRLQKESASINAPMATNDFISVPPRNRGTDSSL